MPALRSPDFLDCLRLKTPYWPHRNGRPCSAGRPSRLLRRPSIQQSPNGLYKLSITDTGIELLGPGGGVKITATEIEIGAPSTTRVTIRSSNMEVRSGQAVRLESGTSMDIRAGSNLDLRGSAAVQVRGDGGASLTGSVVKLGCGPTTGKPAARVGDVVNASANPAVIVQGSPTVQVC